MADVNVSELSDAELRKTLKDLGEKVGPITKSTRSIWEKKLKRLLAEQKGDSANEQPPVEVKKSRRRSAGRGTAVAAAASATVVTSSPSAASRASGRKRATPSRAKVTKNSKLAVFSSDDDQENETVPTTTSVKTSPIGFPSPGVSAVDIALSKKVNLNSSPARRANVSYNTSSSRTQIKPGEQTTRRKTINKVSEFSDDDFSEIATRATNRHKASPLKYPTGNGLHGPSSEISDHYRNIVGASEKQHYPLSSSSSSYHTSSTPNIVHSSHIVQNTKRSSMTLNNDISIRDEIDASLSQIRKSFSSKKPSPIDSYGKRPLTNENTRGLKDQKDTDEDEDDLDEEELEAEFVQRNPFAFLQSLLKNRSTVVYIFFGVIFALFAISLYLYTDETDNLPGIADSSESKASQANIKTANCLFNLLSSRAGKHECGYDGIKSKWLDINSLKKTAEACFSGEVVMKDVISYLKKHFSDHFEFTKDGKQISSKLSAKPLLCRIWTAVSVILYRFLVILAVVATGLFIYFIVKRRWIADDEEARQILYYVDKIIDTLRRHHAVCLENKDIPPYLPIPHVRDMLIPLSSRKKMAKVWQKAVDFLNSSDSRVRVETQQIAGEDFEVWRWIGVCIPKSKKQKTKESSRSQHLSNEQTKSWQGPAFDEIDSVVRMPIVPPTPCLKIRYMHEGTDEKEENWEAKVQNAVIEKCYQDGGEILHIFVDKTSKEGCVYVKCASIDSAGKSFRAMYGNWFDGRLVIVKFVTLARYHQRFPEALTHTVPLKPSNGLASSLNWNKTAS